MKGQIVDGCLFEEHRRESMAINKTYDVGPSSIQLNLTTLSLSRMSITKKKLLAPVAELHTDYTLANGLILND